MRWTLRFQKPTLGPDSLPADWVKLEIKLLATALMPCLSADMVITDYPLNL